MQISLIILAILACLINNYMQSLTFDSEEMKIKKVISIKTEMDQGSKSKAKPVPIVKITCRT